MNDPNRVIHEREPGVLLCIKGYKQKKYITIKLLQTMDLAPKLINIQHMLKIKNIKGLSMKKNCALPE